MASVYPGVRYQAEVEAEVGVEKPSQRFKLDSGLGQNWEAKTGLEQTGGMAGTGPELGLEAGAGQAQLWVWYTWSSSCAAAPASSSSRPQALLPNQEV